MTAEPPLQVESREEIVYLLGEACELEHGLMCEYLYARFSLKRTVGKGLTPEQLDRAQAWESALIGVIKQEMLHRPGRPGRRRAAGRPGRACSASRASRAQPRQRGAAGRLRRPCLRHPCCRYPAGRRAGAPTGKAIHPAGTERDADRHQLRRSQPILASPDVQHRAAGRRQPGMGCHGHRPPGLTCNAQRHGHPGRELRYHRPGKGSSCPPRPAPAGPRTCSR